MMPTIKYRDAQRLLQAADSVEQAMKHNIPFIEIQPVIGASMFHPVAKHWHARQLFSTDTASDYLTIPVNDVDEAVAVSEFLHSMRKTLLVLDPIGCYGTGIETRQPPNTNGLSFDNLRKRDQRQFMAYQAGQSLPQLKGYEHGWARLTSAVVSMLMADALRSAFAISIVSSGAESVDTDMWRLKFRYGRKVDQELSCHLPRTNPNLSYSVLRCRVESDGYHLLNFML